MYFAKALLIGASLVAATVAQTTKIAFTTSFASVTAGSPTTLKWLGGDNTAVTITLQQGAANNLKTVAIITGSGTGNSYTWTPSKSLVNGDNYALKIEQGVSDINYSGLFGLTGGSASSSSSAASTTASSSSAGAIVPVPVSANSSSTMMPSQNATTTMMAGTGMVGTGMVGTGAGASGTGVPMSRNTTMSMATLTATSTTSSPATTSGGSTAASAPSSSTTKAPSSAAGLASPLAFVFSAFVAIVFLG